MPTLRLLHKCKNSLEYNHIYISLPPSLLSLLSTDPHMLPKLQVDKGAIKFVLSGANIMCPGLTSPGAKMEDSVPENTVVVSSL